MNLSGAAIVATAVMVLLAAPVAEAVDSAVDPVVPVERVEVPVVAPALRKAHKAAPVVDRIAGTVLPDPAVMAAIPADAMVALAFAPRVSARPRLRRCQRSTSRSRRKI